MLILGHPGDDGASKAHWLSLGHFQNTQPQKGLQPKWPARNYFFSVIRLHFCDFWFWLIEAQAQSLSLVLPSGSIGRSFCLF